MGLEVNKGEWIEGDNTYEGNRRMAETVKEREEERGDYLS
jgi:chromatin segregation and condensation protein Rec8/ScpA/Scc1 (kleisin family)